jgi:hypothetical protein
MKRLHLILLALFASQIVCDIATEWTDPVSGTKYDFTSLKKDVK